MSVNSDFGTSISPDYVRQIFKGLENGDGAAFFKHVSDDEWVRLAQRIPVRIKLIDVPKETILSSGMTVTVSIVPRR